ncbi:MAG: transposase family protein, partial [Micromonosporaceae bacterium]
MTYLRRNRVQVELAETYGVSQSTISRAITALTGVLGRILTDHVQYIVDGTLLPCWSWAGHRELYSGKHKTTGRSVQVACLHTGALAWISDPVDGSRHDSYAIRQSGVMDTFEPHQWIGDKGYVGLNMLTPLKKPAHRDLLDWETEHNT